jgi:hypothetical protein
MQTHEAMEAYLKHSKPTNYINGNECPLLGCGLAWTRRHISEDSILHSRRRENPKSYIY